MSRAIAVYHGGFGRAGLYQLNRPMTTHAHREGHLILHVSGWPGAVGVGDDACDCSPDVAVGVNPWQPHSFTPADHEEGAIFLVLYVKPSWFASRPGNLPGLRFGRADIALSRTIARLASDVAGLLASGRETQLADGLLLELTSECFEASWRGRQPRREVPAGPDLINDHRVRKSIRILSERRCADLALDGVARESGLSRPHFYKLFREQTGLTPNLYLKTLLMERAIERVTESAQSVTEIGLDLGFPSQSGFTRFFAAHVGMAPTDYRRVAHVRPS